MLRLNESETRKGEILIAKNFTFYDYTFSDYFSLVVWVVFKKLLKFSNIILFIDSSYLDRKSTRKKNITQNSNQCNKFDNNFLITHHDNKKNPNKTAAIVFYVRKHVQIKLMTVSFFLTFWFDVSWCRTHTQLNKNG